MKVAIIGAGIAGLTTARELNKLGAEVSVFEKSRGLGGRLANKRLEWGTIDLGAQYFTARDKRFQDELAQWVQQKVVGRWEFSPCVVTASGLDLKPDNSTRYVGIPKMNRVAHALACDTNITVNSPIGRVELTSEGWLLSLTDGSTINECFDWLVVSAPIEQARTLLASTSLISRFPERLHQPCWALALATKGNIDEKIQGIFGDNVVSWVSRLSSHPQRKTQSSYDDCWMLHFSSSWSKINDENTSINITQVGFNWLTSKLKKYTHSPFLLVHNHKHYWRYARVDDLQTSPFVLADDHCRLAVVGDWLYGGRVEGAYLSALDFVDYFINARQKT